MQQSSSSMPPPPPLLPPLQPTASAEVRRHRLEGQVRRLRVSRAPPPASLPEDPLLQQLLRAVRRKRAQPSAAGGGPEKRAKREQEEQGGPEQEEEEEGEEGFVPSQAPATETQRLQAARARDRVWVFEYWIELSLVLLGLNVGPMLYYYFAARPAGANELSFATGVPFVDRWTAHLTAPARYLQFWTTKERLPSAVPAAVRAFGPLLALCASLVATMALLWNKTGLLQSLANLTKMQAAPVTHVAIAWSWLSALFPLSLVAAVQSALGWMFNTVGMLVSYLCLIVFSHVFAGAAQAGLYVYLLVLLSGLGKRLETGSFGVELPDPDALAEEAAATVAGGGGGGAVPGAEGGEVDLARLFAGPAAAAESALGAASGVVGDAFATATSGAVGDAFATAAASAVPDDADVVSAAAPLLSAGGVALPAYEPLAPYRAPSFLGNLNRGAFRASQYTNEAVLALFAAVKLVNANMQTTEGTVFAYVTNGLLIAGSLGTAAVRLRSAYSTSARVPW